MWSEVAAAMWPDIMSSVNENIVKEKRAMSSQKQWHRIRKALYDYQDVRDENNALRARLVWLERRPPWWKFWAVRKWKGEEPR